MYKFSKIYLSLNRFTHNLIFTNSFRFNKTKTLTVFNPYKNNSTVPNQNLFPIRMRLIEIDSVKSFELTYPANPAPQTPYFVELA